MRVVVCDDDAVVRSVISELVESIGGEVLAETDTAVGALDLIARFEPDAVVLDLALRAGSGIEVVDDLLRGGEGRPHVVIFTAHDSFGPIGDGSIDIILKPDFDGLARRLASLPHRPVERRRPTRTLPEGPFAEVDGAHDFFRVLSGARPGDHLVHLPADEPTLTHLAAAVRGAVRAQDRVLRRSGDVLVLLIDGGAASVRALHDRLRDTFPLVVSASRTVDVGTDPVAAFESLTAPEQGPPSAPLG